MLIKFSANVNYPLKSKLSYLNSNVTVNTCLKLQKNLIFSSEIEEINVKSIFLVSSTFSYVKIVILYGFFHTYMWQSTFFLFRVKKEKENIIYTYQKMCKAAIITGVYIMQNIIIPVRLPGQNKEKSSCGGKGKRLLC